MRVPTWLKWVTVLILMMTTIVVPLVLLEERSDVFVAQVVEWSGDQPVRNLPIGIDAVQDNFSVADLSGDQALADFVAVAAAQSVETGE